MRTRSAPLRCTLEYLLFVALFLACAGGLLILLWWINHQGAAPTQGESEPAVAFSTVVLDAGHGGEDGGAVGKLAQGEVYEKDLNLAIARLVRDRLTAAGVTVIMTRNEDILLYDRNTDYQGRKKVLDLAARLHIGQSTPDALFVSIHMNAFPQSKYCGLQVYYSPHHPLSRTLAEELQGSVAAELQPDNHRKIKEAGSNIFLLDRLTCPAVMVECGFLSNPQECAALQNVDYQARLADLLAACILAAQGTPKAEVSPQNEAKLPLLLHNGLIFLQECDIMRESKRIAQAKTEDAPNERNQNHLYLLGMRTKKPQVAGSLPFLRGLEFLC